MIKSNSPPPALAAMMTVAPDDDDDDDDEDPPPALLVGPAVATGARDGTLVVTVLLHTDGVVTVALGYTVAKNDDSAVTALTLPSCVTSAAAVAVAAWVVTV